MLRSRSVVAGVMRSTMLFGKRHLLAHVGGKRRIDEIGETRHRIHRHVPLPGMLSHDITVKGARPWSRRRLKAATRAPNTPFGASGWAAS